MNSIMNDSVILWLHTQLPIINVNSTYIENNNYWESAPFLLPQMQRASSYLPAAQHYNSALQSYLEIN